MRGWATSTNSPITGRRGGSLDDLIDHLKDLVLDVNSGEIPSIRRVGELVVS